MKIEIDPTFQKALDLLENSIKNVFITGNAGTGKSTLLTYFLNQTSKKVVVLAPTGVSALNVGGETIHSFFKFRPNVTLEKAKATARKIKESSLYQNIDMIIIDEISMVRADLLDCVDAFLRALLKTKTPFGGIRMVFIGDLYQLAPVLTSTDKEYFEKIYDSPYFFSSHVIQKSDFTYQLIELEKIYRQQDSEFIELLNAIRKKTVTDEQLDALNARTTSSHMLDSGAVYLTSTNKSADALNIKKLNELPQKTYTFQAIMKGDFDLKSAPTDPLLKLKVGAQVMFLTNHPYGYWVNGTIGTVVSFEEGEIQVDIDGETVSVEPFNWQLYKYVYDAKRNTLDQEQLGSYAQFPLKLAWAITVHKSQGKTYDKVVIDVSKGMFATGQTYVALSRCRSLQGLSLQGSLKKGHIMLDYRVVKYITNLHYAHAEETCSIDDKTDLIKQAIAKKVPLQITYLKASDEKSTRIIQPTYVGELEYKNKTYLGVEAFCLKRKQHRVFRVDRILEISLTTA